MARPRGRDPGSALPDRPRSTIDVRRDRHGDAPGRERLSAIGVGPGVRVGVGLVNSEETLLVHLALRELKAVIVPLVPGLTEPELRYQLQHSGVERLIIGSPLEEVAEPLLGARPGSARSSAPTVASWRRCTTTRR